MDAPDKIWLQDGGDFDMAMATYDVTWCAAPCHHMDTEYIRADLVQSLIQAAIDIDRQFCDNDLGPSALAMGKLREAYMRLK